MGFVVVFIFGSLSLSDVLVRAYAVQYSTVAVKYHLGLGIHSQRRRVKPLLTSHQLSFLSLFRLFSLEKQ